ncbi:hypothetical protein HPB50_006017 [Hyalomma asiaticum]|uniref:Uncharacterized protein n=1 Tax=Hyalomma asiaticum TaxID=266040 RepID=A0ACB7SL53_HYAAI|nr:hypothetical protein HPB50_006017 [Hyalomma asiaticum]
MIRGSTELRKPNPLGNKPMGLAWLLWGGRDFSVFTCAAVQATPEANAREARPSTSSSVPEGERDKQQLVVASKDQHEAVKGVDTAPAGRDTPPDVQPPESATESVDECMDVSRDGASSMAGKRAHERTVDSEPQREDGGGGEPPAKTPGVRRSPYRPRPNLPGEPRRAGNPPP